MFRLLSIFTFVALIITPVVGAAGDEPQGKTGWQPAGNNPRKK